VSYVRRLLLPAVLLALLAGCAATSRLDRVAEFEPASPPVRTLTVRHLTRAVVRVTVVNGDTHKRVRGARVVIGKRGDYADAKGVAKVRLRARTALEVRASAPGYSTRTVRMPFKARRLVTIKLYRPALQWPMYGASPSRTQAQREIAIRPPFKVVWSRGIGSLIEFPAVVSDGVAYIGNYRGTIYAVSMADGKLVWKYDPPGGKMASSPAVVGRNVVVHGMDGIVRVIDRANGRLRWQLDIGSPIESSPVVRGELDYFGAWNGRVYALDLAKRRLRWNRATGAKVTSSAALAGRTLYIGNYAGRLLALSARTGQTVAATGDFERLRADDPAAAARLRERSRALFTDALAQGLRPELDAANDYVFVRPATDAMAPHPEPQP